MIELDEQDILRYARQLTLNEIGITGQIAIKNARVLVIGAGGLGCPVLLYLTAAGVGTIEIVDHDVVDESNLQRQVLYTTIDIGRSKTSAAKIRLEALNPHVKIIEHNFEINKDNTMPLFSNYDIAVDATDNFATKFLINDACFFSKIPMIYASISQFEGQLSVFNYLDPETDTIGPNYRDLFPSPPPAHLTESCKEAGVIGVLPGLLGCFQANETLKIIVKMGKPLSGKVLLIDALTMQNRSMLIENRADNPLRNMTFSSNTLNELSFAQNTSNSPSISAFEFNNWILRNEIFQLIDVREKSESAEFSLGGVLLPLIELPDRISEIRSNMPLVFYCKSGLRSRQAVSLVKEAFPEAIALSLENGLDAYVASGYICAVNNKKNRTT
ncbi:molybdopterin-synthase adenylyltransferase MoeB [Pseudomonas sp. O230]|uniref:molybdopterin-synthase adenylyltransferase MoeB n=1 Tax=Pseudomonas sp. O230 TaxID=3159450 RepID=UPI00387AA3DE